MSSLGVLDLLYSVVFAKDYFRVGVMNICVNQCLLARVWDVNRMRPPRKNDVTRSCTEPAIISGSISQDKLLGLK